jgi:hypothetical protein
MSRTLAFNGAVDLASAIGAGFEPAGGFDGRLYRNGVLQDASAVTVSVVVGEPKRVLIGNLPDDAGARYAITVVVSGLGAALHWPEDAFFPHRVVAVRETAQTTSSLDLVLLEDGVVSASPLAIAEGKSDAGDWIVTGWPTSGSTADWSLTAEKEGFGASWNWATTAVTAPASVLALSGRNLSLSRTVASLARSSATIRVLQRASDRDGGTPLSSLELDGVHAAGSASLVLKTASGGPLRGVLPSGLTVTTGGTPYVTTAEAKDDGANRITVSITPVLAALGADGAAVALNDSVEYAVSRVLLRPANHNEVARQVSFGREITNRGSFPGHLMPALLQSGDAVRYVRDDSRVYPFSRVEATEDTQWGQRVFT